LSEKVTVPRIVKFKHYDITYLFPEEKNVRDPHFYRTDAINVGKQIN